MARPLGWALLKLVHCSKLLQSGNVMPSTFLLRPESRGWEVLWEEILLLLTWFLIGGSVGVERV